MPLSWWVGVKFVAGKQESFLVSTWVILWLILLILLFWGFRESLLSLVHGFRPLCSLFGKYLDQQIKTGGNKDSGQVALFAHWFF